ncbi:cupin domain-containing protein [Streptomyces sp. NBC_00102]|uniref:cupin domain-containing protein n=1 Tax=Streptomyces sp. NBC_00102 TaxID=2975652 RepID=UPI002258A349|nr:cupin [Streptomyces sp. NBC_00102]MCX5398974.1 cupin [Streptomyces sp. NBC_00102]
MYVISESEQRTTVTPAASAFALAGPSQGSTELSTWRVEFGAGSAGPVHSIDREQVWMPLSGVLGVEVDGVTGRVAAGQALVLPADVVRQLTALEGPMVALVAMAAGGTAARPGDDTRIPLPWAE